MPWKSLAQAGWGHSPAGHKALGARKVAEFDQATRRQKRNLPKKAKGKRGGKK